MYEQSYVETFWAWDFQVVEIDGSQGYLQSFSLSLT